MSRFQAVTASFVVLVGCATVIFLQQRQAARLQREAAALRHQAATAAELQRENERLTRAAADAVLPLSREERHELLRLRSEVSRLRQQVKDLSASVSRGPAPRGPSSSEPATTVPLPPAGQALIPDGFLPADRWADVGLGTPEAAFETLNWAMRHGNQERMKQGLLLPDETLPDGAQPAGMDRVIVPPGTPGTGESQAPTVLHSQIVTSPLPEVTGSRIVSRQDIAPDAVSLSVENQHADGTRLPAQMTFRRVGNEWKLAPTIIQAPAPGNP